MLRVVLALFLAAHGIGHILFLGALLGLEDWQQSTHSWLLTNDGAARAVGSLVWIAAIIVFCIAVYGLWTQESWWRNVAIAAAVISSAGIFLFWASPATSSAFLALVFNLVVLASLLLIQWPSVEAVGA